MREKMEKDNFERIIEAMFMKKKQEEFNICNKQYDENIISAYMDNTLSDEERKKFEKHLISCHDCRQQIISLNRTLTDIKEKGLEKTPEYLEQKALSTYKVKERISILTKLRQSLTPAPRLRLATVTVAVVLVLIAAFITKNIIILPTQVAKKEQKRKEAITQIKPLPEKEGQIKVVKEELKEERQKLEVKTLVKKQIKSKEKQKKTTKSAKLLTKKEEVASVKPEGEMPSIKRYKTLPKSSIVAIAPLDNESFGIVTKRISTISRKENRVVFEQMLKEKGIKLPRYGIKEIKIENGLRKRLMTERVKKESLYFQLSKKGVLYLKELEPGEDIKDKKILETREGEGF